MDDHGKRGFIESLSSKAAFKFGLIAGLAAMFIIGFFILLGLVLTGNANTGNIGKNLNTGNTNVNTNDTGTTGVINLVAIDKDEWIRGDKNAKVTIVEYSDMDCPFCQNFHATMQQVMTTYGKDVNWVYRHFPLTSLHPEAEQKAEASECVGEQGGNDKFWAFLDVVFSNSTEKVADLPGIVTNLGLNATKFSECLASGKYKDKVQQQYQEAQAAGGRGTPYSIIVAGDTKTPINGALPFATVKAQVDAILAK